MNQVIINRRTYQVPGRFDELQPRQLTRIAALLHSDRPAAELRLRLVLVLLDVPRRLGLAWALWFRFSPEQRHELLPLADFCFEEPRLTRQLLPRLRVPGRFRVLRGPADGFADLPFARFIEAEGHFAAYQRKRAALPDLVATLYACTAADARRLSTGTLLAVLMWFVSCRAAWARKYQGTIFTAPAGDSGAKHQDARETWREILAERAGSPVHYDEYGRQPVPNVFYDLHLRIQRRREDQENIKNQSR